MWEGLSYDDVADALRIPVGTVRSRRSTAPVADSRARAGTGRAHRPPRPWEDPVVTDDFDPLRQLRPDRIEPDDPGDPAVFSRAKEQLMSAIDHDHSPSDVTTTPDVYPRLASRDELAAVDYLTASSSSRRTARHAWSTRASSSAGSGWARVS